MKRWGEKFRVLLVEDDNLLRETLVELLDLQPDITVIGGVSTVAHARECLQNESIDVVLLDYDLGNGLAFALVEHVRKLASPPSVLLLSREMNSSAMHRLAASGVRGILWKYTGFRDLTKAIREAALEPSKALHVEAAESWFDLGQPMFTNRQLDVGRAVLMGCGTKEIASELGVSVGAIKSTLQQLFAKTGTRSRPQLVRALLERHRLSPSPKKGTATA